MRQLFWNMRNAKVRHVSYNGESWTDEAEEEEAAEDKRVCACCGEEMEEEMEEDGAVDMNIDLAGCARDIVKHPDGHSDQNIKWAEVKVKEDEEEEEEVDDPNGESSIVFCCQACERPITRDSKDHDNCICDEDGERWWCDDCRDCPEARIALVWLTGDEEKEEEEVEDEEEGSEDERVCTCCEEYCSSIGGIAATYKDDEIAVCVACEDFVFFCKGCGQVKFNDLLYGENTTDGEVWEACEDCFSEEEEENPYGAVEASGESDEEE